MNKFISESAFQGKETRMESVFFSGKKSFPFSFSYDRKLSSELLKAWSISSDTTYSDNNWIKYTHVFSDYKTGLKVTCEACEFIDFRAIEWVIYFENTGNSDTTILENINALDIDLPGNENDTYILHHSKGSCSENVDFLPQMDFLKYQFDYKKLSCYGGRSSNGCDIFTNMDGYTVARKEGAFPFFNIEYANGGVICAIGWTGQWIAEFKRNNDIGLEVTAGMELTHLKLHPGEKIRTPRILMFFWEGDRIKGDNDFRKFILQYHTPKKNGKPVQLPLAAISWFKYNYGNDVNEENQIEFIHQYVDKKIPVEYYWLDAGWYEGVGNWAIDIGNWFPKKKAFPQGLKPVTEVARKNNMGFILWFEPERVHPGTQLFIEHPDWLIMPDELIENKRHPLYKGEALLNLGNPDAVSWLVNHMSLIIQENRVSIYRQDCNIDCLDYWRKTDGSDRQGITEIKYIEGLYTFWDELLRRNPELIIDNCASGGRRIDLETISRSIVLWRSDYASEPEGVQSHTTGISRYIPCSSCAAFSTDPYLFRSKLGPGMALAWDLESKDFNVEEARKRIEEFKTVRPFFYGDFYPLTGHSTADDVWCAFQLNRDDLGSGALFLFRRIGSPYSFAHFKLRGLNTEYEYELTDVDTGDVMCYSGKQLSKDGIDVHIDRPQGSKILLYRIYCR